MATDDRPETQPDRRPTDFAGKLRRLNAVLHPPGQPPLSDRAISAKVRAMGGSISPAYVSELKSGKKTAPSLDHAHQLAAAFGVSPGYFSDPEVFERISAELDQLEDIALGGREELVELATRTASLDSRDRAALAALVQRELAARAPQEQLPQGSSEA